MRRVIEVRAKKELSPWLYKKIAFFLERFKCGVILACYPEGFPADVILAQIALETGWGEHILKGKDPETGEVVNSNNIFNIKAGESWTGKTVWREVKEYKDGKTVYVKAVFRRYNNIKESIEDYLKLIKSFERYKEAVENRYNPIKFIKALQEGGYATDPRYSQKILSIWEKYFKIIFEVTEVENV